MKKMIALLLAVMMVVGCMAGCAKTEQPAQTTTSTQTTQTTETTESSSSAAAIKIGGQGPLSGPAAIYGIAAMRGAEVAVNEINEKAGTTVFELKYEDDEHDVSKAPNAYNALKDWGMQVSLGAVTSKPCAAIGPFTAEDGIFALTPSASADIVPETSSNMFQMCFSDNNQGSGSAVYMAAHMADAKIAIIYESDIDYSVGITDSFKEKADELGLTIVSESTYVANDVDFSVQIAEAKNAGADVVFIPIYYNEASLILAQAKTAEYAPVWFGVDGMDGLLDLEGFDTSLAEGLYMLTPFDANAAVSANFVSLYQAAYGETPIQFAADCYDCVYAIYEAVQAKGITADMATADITAALVEWFTTESFTGITGTDLTWDVDGFVSKQPMCVVVKDGAYASAE